MPALLSKPLLRTTAHSPFVQGKAVRDRTTAQSKHFGAQYFQDKHYKYEEWHRDQARWIVSYLFDYVRPQPKWVALDIGCALGGVVEVLRRRKVEAYGIDISRWCLTNSPVKQYLQFGSATALPCKDQSIDITICTDTFQYLTREELHAAIRELKRVTKRYVFFECLTQEDRLSRSDVNPDHLRKGRSLLKRRELLKLFEDAGFFCEVQSWLPRHIDGSWLGHGWYEYDFSFNALFRASKTQKDGAFSPKSHMLPNRPSR